MSEAILLLVLLAFFGLCALYVQALDRMIRKDDIVEPTTQTAPEGTR